MGYVNSSDVVKYVAWYWLRKERRIKNMEKKVFYKEEEPGVARCPGCGATFYEKDEREETDWGRKVCGHCGQKLDWTGVIKEKGEGI